MTKNRRMPDRRQTPAKSMGQKKRRPPSPTAVPHSPTPLDPAAQNPKFDTVLQPESTTWQTAQDPFAANSSLNGADSSEAVQDQLHRPAKPLAPVWYRRLRLPTSWQFWVITAVVTTMGTGVLASALLLRLPTLPNCPKIFWPTASASLRLYCAQIAANKQTVTNLLSAIELVNSLPEDHPLRPEINRNIEQWSLDILSLGDDAFNMGKLSEAIAIARKIPTNAPAYKFVNERISQWQSTWSKAEEIFREAEAELRKENWPAAFRHATRLLSIGNTYWETTKYQELNNIIRTARDDSNKLGRARRLADEGGVDNLLAAIKLAEEIGSESYIYQEAQKEIPRIARKMLTLAEATLEARDTAGAIAIARKIPASAKLQDEVQDFITIAQATSQAQVGTIPTLEDAILQAQKVTPGRPLYGKAQQLITRWQREIEDVAHLERARQLAQPGSLSDLAAAIAELQLIPRNNPRWEEAQEMMGRWTNQIQTAEDRPYLDRAEQLAISGDVIALQAAVDEASRIGQGRALYQEARNRIRDWTQELQRIQDQPYLDQARILADSGDVAGAIATAQQIQSGRALYDEAQGSIRAWRALVQARQSLQEARDLAAQATPDSLAAAIRVADQVPGSNYLRSEADSLMGQWSQQILNLAEAQASYNLPEAIAIAQKVPARTSAYATAQLRIEGWRQILNPPATTPEPPLSSSPSINN